MAPAPAKQTDSSRPFARWLITGVTLAYGFGPWIVDVNHTHVEHAAWTPHARLHAMWLIVTNSAVALLALGIMWRRGPTALFRARMAVGLGFCMVGSFFVAAALAPFYGGSMEADVPMRKVFGLDGNLLSCLIMSAGLLVGLVMLGRSQSSVRTDPSG
jgi:hypothetical protein